MSAKPVTDTKALERVGIAIVVIFVFVLIAGKADSASLVIFASVTLYAMSVAGFAIIGIMLPYFVMGRIRSTFEFWRKELETIYPNEDGVFPHTIHRSGSKFLFRDPSRELTGTIIVDLDRDEYYRCGGSEEAQFGLASQSNLISHDVSAHHQNVTVLPKTVINNAKSVRFEDGTNAQREQNTDYERVDDYVEQPMETDEPMRVVLPDMIELPDILRNETISINSLYFGKAVVDCNLVDVRAGLSQLTHVLVAGSTKWGKSVFLRSMLYQLCSAQENVSIVLADRLSTSFKSFSTSDRLLFPILDTDDGLVKALGFLSGECERRKALFGSVENVDTIEGYNKIADEPLEPIVAVIDESSLFLSNPAIQEGIRTLTYYSRHFGILVMMSGNTFSGKDIDTRCILQFNSRFQFHSPIKNISQGVTMEIDGRTARDISTRGRCFVEIPGVVEGAEMQTPYVTPEMIGDKFRGHGPRFPLSNLDGIVVPEMASIAISNEQRELAIKLHREGKPQYKIEEAIFGYHGGLAYWTVSDILKTVIKSKIVNSTNSTSTTVDNKTGAKRSSSRKRAV